MTIIEKIIASHANLKSVTPQEEVWISIDYRSARDFGGANVVEHLEKHYSDNPIQNRTQTYFTFDTNAPANTIGYANNQHRCRIFARKWGIPLADVDAGIGTHIAIERGLVTPGSTAVGTDSHFNILAAVGAFGQGMGDLDIAYIFRSGRTWFEVPHTVKINLEGIPDRTCTAKDITLLLMKSLGTKTVLGKCAEIYGEYIDGLTLDERITLCSMATEAGAISFFLPPSEVVTSHYEEHLHMIISQPQASEDAKYYDEIHIDISGIAPMVSMPGSPNDVRPVKEVSGVPVDSVFVGSCTNGRISDLHMVAEILDGRKIADGVMFKVVPATRKTYEQILEDGTMSKLIKSGVIVSHSGCGGCASGQLGMTGAGEVQVSTSNRNFKGKQGLGETYLTSPRTASWSALRGVLCNED